MKRAGLLLLALVGCNEGPVPAEPDVAIEADLGPRFADLGGLRDGTVVRFDRGIDPTRDAAIITEAGVCAQGRVFGAACTPDNNAIINATVTASTRDCDGNPIIVETLSTGPRGNFRLAGLAPGPTEVTISSGNFLGRFQVNVVANTEVPIAEGVSGKACLTSRAAKLAVLTGDFDRIQQVLDGMGFEYDLFCGDRSNHRPGRQMLADWDRLSEYDIVFINCGPGINLRHDNPEVTAIADNLRRFVAEGGSVYVSDLAADFVAALWPGRVEFLASTPRGGEADACCVCTDCSAECIEPAEEAGVCPDPTSMPQSCRTTASAGGRGVSGEILAAVPSPFLQEYLDSTPVNIDFNLGGWVQIESVAPEVEVLVEASRPLMVIFEPEPGSGRVAYTSFHNHAQASDVMRQILSALVLRL